MKSFLTRRVVFVLRTTVSQSRVRLFSTPSASNVETTAATTKSKLPPFQTPLSELTEFPNAVGKYYHSLLYKGRQVYKMNYFIHSIMYKY